MRFHIRAWGSDKYPDIDEEVNEVPHDLTWKYPMVDAACLTPITYGMINRAMRDEK